MSTRVKGKPLIASRPKLIRVALDRHIGLPKASQIELPALTRGVDLGIARELNRCIRSERSVEVRYMSMNDNGRKNPRWRRITPHAFAHDGVRSYIRAFCHTDMKFKDFVLCRFLGIRKKGKAGTLRSSDRHWARHLNVTLIVNPALSKNQKQAVALEYEMKHGRRVVEVRHAALIYLKRRLRLDTAGPKDAPRHVPVCIENRDEVDAAIGEAAR